MEELAADAYQRLKPEFFFEKNIEFGKLNYAGQQTFASLLQLVDSLGEQTQKELIENSKRLLDTAEFGKLARFLYEKCETWPEFVFPYAERILRVGIGAEAHQRVLMGLSRQKRKPKEILDLLPQFLLTPQTAVQAASALRHQRSVPIEISHAIARALSENGTATAHPRQNLNILSRNYYLEVLKALGELTQWEAEIWENIPWLLRADLTKGRYFFIEIQAELIRALKGQKDWPVQVWKEVVELALRLNALESQARSFHNGNFLYKATVDEIVEAVFLKSKSVRGLDSSIFERLRSGIHSADFTPTAQNRLRSMLHSLNDCIAKLGA